MTLLRLMANALKALHSFDCSRVVDYIDRLPIRHVSVVVLFCYL